MKAKIIFSVITLFILSACVKESFTNPHNDNIGDLSVTITGNSMWGFSNKNSRAATISQIPENGQIKFYSQGGITADGDILTLENGQWTVLKNDKWDTNGNDASIAAYYPVINDFSQLYSENGELQDMVWCKTTAELGKNVNLTFSHMFAKLVINIESELNDTVKDVKVKIPSKISGIDFYTGKLSFLEGGNADVTLPQKYNGKYEIFIPASDKCNIALDITCNKGKKYNPSIDNSEYKAGYEYICNVKLSKKGNGIYTTTDFIAFTHLINNYLTTGNEDYTCNGKKLSNFYVMQDGKRVFNLYNDLSFTDEEAALIKQIGFSNYNFEDIFNGNNHILNGITLNDNETTENYCGIFRNVGTNGIIKNLIINNINLSSSTIKYKYGSLFVGYNKGLIDNCHILSGKMYLNGEMYGGFNFINYGIIVNCSISNLSLSNSEGNLGIFAYQNNSTIINCLINNNIDNKTNGKSSSVITTINNSRLYNIFVNGYNSGYYGICHKNTSHYDNCILPIEYKGKSVFENSESSTAIRDVKFYEDLDAEKQNIVDSLNKWTEEIETSRPLTFRRWTTDPTQKVIFE